MIYDYIVVGSGISGISSAKILSEKKKKVKILEAKPYTGGLVHCEISSGNLYHKVGGHVFNSKNEDVLAWFWKYFDKENEFIPAKRNAQIWMNNSFFGYPLENFLYKLPEDILKKVINDILALSSQKEKPPMHYDNFEQFLKGNFGETLYELYFHPYNQKIWQFDLSQVPMEWLKGKLPMPNYRDIILQNILQKEESDMVHSSFYYPKRGGSQFIIDRLAEGLDINCNEPVTEISYENDVWTLNKKWKTKNIVYTGDVRNLRKISQPHFAYLDKLFDTIEKLPSHGTSNLLCECDKTDLSWLYIPEKKFKTHRIIYTGNFSPYNNSNNNGDRISCTVEFSGEQDLKTMTEEIKKLPGNLKALDSNKEKNSYIIHRKNTQTSISQLQKELNNKNFILLGRFAEWEYYNMDKAIEKALSYFQPM
ncbi:protoporphyrinogen/coproporphyrinogen oxidase [Salinimicrobium sediminilitoris]|uniref:protoporphyrinogen/coproporphyrinogen oxidase n=1 Tax=Salinimicrobium sediminilitoris TaxID=2876715 RepID=UPI001E452BB6|nr:FAD-dependent oxidoreductase [Salinimicrobium sediminilitoris]MCC8358455.1 FAD-dependent oxidoreductase [Salinimicrobium sediminilitoris]